MVKLIQVRPWLYADTEERLRNVRSWVYFDEEGIREVMEEIETGRLHVHAVYSTVVRM